MPADAGGVDEDGIGLMRIDLLDDAAGDLDQIADAELHGRDRARLFLGFGQVPCTSALLELGGFQAGQSDGTSMTTPNPIPEFDAQHRR